MKFFTNITEMTFKKFTTRDTENVYHLPVKEFTTFVLITGNVGNDTPPRNIRHQSELQVQLCMDVLSSYLIRANGKSIGRSMP